MYGVNLLILIYSFHLHSLSKHEAHIKIYIVILKVGT